MAKQIHVHTAFNLNREDGTQQHFARGAHTVSDADANHWFVKHCAEVGADVEDEDEEVVEAEETDAEEEATDDSGEEDSEEDNEPAKPLTKAQRRALARQQKS